MPGFRQFQTEPEAVSRVLRAAERLVRDRGWCTGKLFAGGCYCLEGAIRVAGNGNDPVIQDAMRVVRIVLCIPHGGIRALFDWNDAPGRTADQVIQALDDAAERAPFIMTQPIEVAA